MSDPIFGVVRALWGFFSAEHECETCTDILGGMATETTPKTEQIPEYLPRERPPGIPLLKLIASDGTVVIDETKWRKNPAYLAAAGSDSSDTSSTPAATLKPVLSE